MIRLTAGDTNSVRYRDVCNRLVLRVGDCHSCDCEHCDLDGYMECPHCGDMELKNEHYPVYVNNEEEELAGFRCSSCDGEFLNRRIYCRLMKEKQELEKILLNHNTITNE